MRFSRRAILPAILLTTALLQNPAFATHEPIAIDGDLTDLIAAIGRNTGSTAGGFAVPDIQGDVYTDKCPGFVNGYDVRNYYLFYDFRNADGSVSTNPTLYAGWDVYGIIGDVDGDGNPNTFNNPQGGCALSDESGIGPIESYRLILSFCGARIAQIVIKDFDGNGTLDVQLDGATIPATAVFVANRLELRVPDLGVRIPGVDLCNIEVFMTANAENDGLGEDVNDQRITIDVPPRLTITKSPEVQAACPDREVVWTITVRNDGLCPLQTLAVEDTLQAGLTFASSTPPRSGGDTQRSFWNLGAIAPGGTQVITLRSRTSATCAGEILNRVGASAFHDLPASCATLEETARATALARVTCTAPVCAILDGAGAPPPGKILVGTPLTLCAPAGLTYRWTRPSGAIEAGRCITIAAASPADSGTYALTVTDASGCARSCSFLLDVNRPDEIVCRISGPDTLCVGAPLTLCGPREPAGVNLSYRWTLPDLSMVTTPDSCLTVANPAPGYYTLVVRNEGTGVETPPCTHRLQIQKPPGCAIAAPAVVRAGDEVQICGPIGGFTYRWTLPSGAIRTDRCIVIPSASAADVGVYTLVVTTIDTGCSSDPCTYRLDLDGVPCVITGPDKVAAGSPVELCGPTGDFTYRWVHPNGTITADRCVTIGAARVTDSGFYRLTVTNSAGSSASCEVKLVVNEPPPCKNCPRTADFWSKECDLRHTGDGKFAPAQLEAIAACVDGLSSFLDFGAVPPPPSSDGVVVARRSEWRYHDLGQDLGSAWRLPSTSDASWKAGVGVFGYGESYINTTVSFGPSSSNRYLTTYFRRAFTIAGASTLTGLTLRLLYDDGAVVYLNGVEVVRRSMPSGAVSYLTQAHSHEAENAYETIDLSAFLGLLQEGANLLAVEVHQVSPGSTDLAFDAELEVARPAPPSAGLPARRSDWTYHDLGQNLGTAWRDPGYVPLGWKTGPGVLGYGESYIDTRVSYGSDADRKHITTYFRKTFTLSSLTGIGALELGVMYDDGVIVYLNGVEVARRSMPSGAVTHLTTANSHEAENRYVTIDLGSYVGLLRVGTNVLAAEVHQSDAGSSDLVFDAELRSGSTAAADAAAALERLGAPVGVWGSPALDRFCELLDGDHGNDRSEAKRQFVALLANICASSHTPQTGDRVCLDPGTEVECKYFDARTIGELIAEVDARLAALEGRPLDEVKDDYEDIIDCLTDINNGWSIEVAKECEEDDKKGRITRVGTDVVVPLGPEVTVVFDAVTIEGLTFIGYGPGWGLPSEVRSVTGQSIEVSTTAACGGSVDVIVTYDPNLISAPAHTLKLLRYDHARQVWDDVTTSRDPALHRIVGSCSELSSFVLTEPWSSLSVGRDRRTTFALHPGMPNPTSGRTMLRYTLSRRGPVKLTVHDIQGRQVATLAEGPREPGDHAVAWNGRRGDGERLAAGIYVLRLQAAEGTLTGKLVIVN